MSLSDTLTLRPSGAVPDPIIVNISQRSERLERRLSAKKNYEPIGALYRKLETEQNRKYFSSKVLRRSPYLAPQEHFTKYVDLRIWH